MLPDDPLFLDNQVDEDLFTRPDVNESLLSDDYMSQSSLDIESQTGDPFSIAKYHNVFPTLSGGVRDRVNDISLNSLAQRYSTSIYRETLDAKSGRASSIGSWQQQQLRRIDGVGQRFSGNSTFVSRATDREYRYLIGDGQRQGGDTLFRGVFYQLQNSGVVGDLLRGHSSYELATQVMGGVNPFESEEERRKSRKTQAQIKMGNELTIETNRQLNTALGGDASSKRLIHGIDNEGIGNYHVKVGYIENRQTGVINTVTIGSQNITPALSRSGSIESLLVFRTPTQPSGTSNLVNFLQKEVKEYVDASLLEIRKHNEIQGRVNNLISSGMPSVPMPLGTVERHLERKRANRMFLFSQTDVIRKWNQVLEVAADTKSKHKVVISSNELSLLTSNATSFTEAEQMKGLIKSLAEQGRLMLVTDQGTVRKIIDRMAEGQAGDFSVIETLLRTKSIRTGVTNWYHDKSISIYDESGHLQFLSVGSANLSANSLVSVEQKLANIDKLLKEANGDTTKLSAYNQQLLSLYKFHSRERLKTVTENTELVAMFGAGAYYEPIYGERIKTLSQRLGVGLVNPPISQQEIRRLLQEDLQEAAFTHFNTVSGAWLSRLNIQGEQVDQFSPSNVGAYHTNYIAENRANSNRLRVLRSGLETLKSHLVGTGVNIEIENRYAPDARGKDLLGLRVTVSAKGFHKQVVDLTVQNTFGEADRDVVIITNYNKVITGSAFVNKAPEQREVLTLARNNNGQERWELRTVLGNESVQMSAMDTTVGMIATIGRAMAYQSIYALPAVMIQHYAQTDPMRMSKASQKYMAILIQQEIANLKSNKALQLSGDLDNFIETLRGNDDLTKAISAVGAMSDRDRNLVLSGLKTRLIGKSDVGINNTALVIHNTLEAEVNKVNELFRKNSAGFAAGDLHNLIANNLSEITRASKILGHTLYLMIARDEYMGYMNIAKDIILNDPSYRKAFIEAARSQSKVAFTDIISGFQASHELGYASWQAQSRRPVYGEDVSYDSKNVYEKAASLGWMNPLAMQAGTYVGKAGEYFVPMGASAYGTDLTLPFKGGLKQLKVVDADLSTGVASVHNMNILMRTTPGMTLLNHSEIQGQLKAILDRAVQGGYLTARDKEEKAKEIESIILGMYNLKQDMYLFAFAAGKEEQLQQRLKNIQGGKNTIAISRRFINTIKSIIAQSLYETKQEREAGGVPGSIARAGDSIRELHSYLNGSETSTRQSYYDMRMRYNMGQAQLEDLKRVSANDWQLVKRWVAIGRPAGTDPSISKVFNWEGAEARGTVTERDIAQFMAEVELDPLHPSKGVVGSPLKKIYINQGFSLMGDWGYISRHYQVSPSTHSVGEVTRHKIKVMTSRVDNIVQTQRLLSRVLEKGTIIFSTPREVEIDGVVLKMDAGMYSYDPDTNRYIKVGNYDSAGMIKIDGAGLNFDTGVVGEVIEPILFKAPTFKRRYENGTSIIISTPHLISTATGSLEIEVDVLTESTFNTGSRHVGFGAAKFPRLVVDGIEQIDAAREAARNGQVDKSNQLTKALVGDNTPTYGLLNFNLFKSFNFETGIAMVAKADAYRLLVGMSQDSYARALALLLSGEARNQKALVQHLRGLNTPEAKTAARALQMAGSAGLKMEMVGLNGSDKGKRYGFAFRLLEQTIKAKLGISSDDFSMIDAIEVALNKDHTEASKYQEAIKNATIAIFNLARQEGVAVGKDRYLSDSNLLVSGAGLLANSLYLGQQVLNPVLNQRMTRGLGEINFADPKRYLEDLSFRQIADNVFRTAGIDPFQLPNQVLSENDLTLEMARSNKLETQEALKTEIKKKLDMLQARQEMSFLLETVVDLDESRSLVATGRSDRVKEEFQYYAGMSTFFHNPYDLRAIQAKTRKEMVDTQTAFWVLTNAVHGGMSLDISHETRLQYRFALADGTIRNKANIGLSKVEIAQRKLLLAYSDDIRMVGSRRTVGDRVISLIKGLHLEPSTQRTVQQKDKSGRITTKSIGRTVTSVLHTIESELLWHSLSYEERAEVAKEQGLRLRYTIADAYSQARTQGKMTDAISNYISGTLRATAELMEEDGVLQKQIRRLTSTLTRLREEEETLGLSYGERINSLQREVIRLNTARREAGRAARNLQRTKMLILPGWTEAKAGDGLYKLNFYDPDAMTPTVGVLMGTDIMTNAALAFGGFKEDAIRVQYEMVKLMATSEDVLNKAHRAMTEPGQRSQIKFTREEIEILHKYQSVLGQTRESFMKLLDTDIVRTALGDHETYMGATGVAINIFSLAPDEILIGNRYMNLVQDPKIHGVFVNQINLISQSYHKDTISNRLGALVDLSMKFGSVVPEYLRDRNFMDRYVKKLKSTRRELDPVKLTPLTPDQKRLVFRDTVVDYLTEGVWSMRANSNNISGGDKGAVARYLYSELVSRSLQIKQAEVNSWLDEQSEVITYQDKDMEHNVSRILGMMYQVERTGAPSGIGFDVANNKTYFPVLLKQLQQRQASSGSILSINKEGMETGLIVPAMSRLIAGWGDYDGDTYRLVANVLNEEPNMAEVRKQQKEIQRKLEHRDTVIRNYYKSKLKLGDSVERLSFVIGRPFHSVERKELELHNITNEAEFVSNMGTKNLSIKRSLDRARTSFINYYTQGRGNLYRSIPTITTNVGTQRKPKMVKRRLIIGVPVAEEINQRINEMNQARQTLDTQLDALRGRQGMGQFAQTLALGLNTDFITTLRANGVQAEPLSNTSNNAMVAYLKDNKVRRNVNTYYGKVNYAMQKVKNLHDYLDELDSKVTLADELTKLDIFDSTYIEIRNDIVSSLDRDINALRIAKDELLGSAYSQDFVNSGELEKQILLGKLDAAQRTKIAIETRLAKAHTRNITERVTNDEISGIMAKFSVDGKAMQDLSNNLNKLQDHEVNVDRMTLKAQDDMRMWVENMISLPSFLIRGVESGANSGKMLLEAMPTGEVLSLISQKFDMKQVEEGAQFSKQLDIKQTWFGKQLSEDNSLLMNSLRAGHLDNVREYLIHRLNKDSSVNKHITADDIEGFIDYWSGLDKEKQQTEQERLVAEYLAFDSNIAMTMKGMAGALKKASGFELSAIDFESSQNLTRTSGTIMIGKAYNTFIPMLDSVMVEQSLRDSIVHNESMRQSVMEAYKEGRLTLEDLQKVGVRVVIPTQPDGTANQDKAFFAKDENWESGVTRVRGTISLLGAVQQLVRDSLKAKEGGSLMSILQEKILINSDDTTAMTLGEFLDQNQSEDENYIGLDRKRMQVIRSFLLSKLGGDLSYKPTERTNLVGANSFIERRLTDSRVGRASNEEGLGYEFARLLDTADPQLTSFGTLLEVSGYVSAESGAEFAKDFINTWNLGNEARQALSHGLASNEENFVQQKLVSLLERTEAAFKTSTIKGEQRKALVSKALAWHSVTMQQYAPDNTGTFLEGGTKIDESPLDRLRREQHMAISNYKTLESQGGATSKQQEALLNDLILLEIQHRNKAHGVLTDRTLAHLREHNQGKVILEQMGRDGEPIQERLAAAGTFAFNTYIRHLRRGQAVDSAEILAMAGAKIQAINAALLSGEEEQQIEISELKSMVAPLLGNMTDRWVDFILAGSGAAKGVPVVRENLERMAQTSVGMRKMFSYLATLHRLEEKGYEGDDNVKQSIKQYINAELQLAMGDDFIPGQESGDITSLSGFDADLTDPQMLESKLTVTNAAQLGGVINEQEEALSAISKQVAMIEQKKNAAARRAMYGDLGMGVGSALLMSLLSQGDIKLGDRAAMFAFDAAQAFGAMEAYGETGTGERYLRGRGFNKQLAVMRSKEMIEQEGLTHGIIRGIGQEVGIRGIAQLVKSAGQFVLGDRVKTKAGGLALDVTAEILGQGLSRAFNPSPTGNPMDTYNRTRDVLEPLMDKVIDSLWRDESENFESQMSHIETEEEYEDEVVDFRTKENSFEIAISTGWLEIATEYDKPGEIEFESDTNWEDMAAGVETRYGGMNAV